MRSQFIIFMSLIVWMCQVQASGCDPNFFYNGQIKQQIVLKNYGKPSALEGQQLIEEMYLIHRNTLHSWALPPKINEIKNIKRVETWYDNLDTDCGWSKYGSALVITHLEIESDQGVFLYPDVFKDIYPEYAGPDSLIRIIAAQLEHGIYSVLPNFLLSSIP